MPSIHRYFFYRVAADIPKAGILIFVALFVIIGNVVDDVFVFYDTFANVRDVTAGEPGCTITKRLSYTLSKVSKYHKKHNSYIYFTNYAQRKFI